MSFEEENDDDMFGGGEDKADNNDTISINLKNVQGDTDAFEVKLSDTIGSLIQKYAKDRGLGASAKVLLTFKGKTLKESDTIQGAGIESDDDVHVIIRLKGGNH